MLDLPPVSGLLVPPVSAPLALLDSAVLVPLVPPPEADSDELPPGFGEVLCDPLAEVEVFGLPVALAVAVAPPVAPGAGQFVAPGAAALLEAVVVGGVLSLAGGELGGFELSIPGPDDGLVVPLDEFPGLGGLDGGGLTGGLDVFGAVLGDDTALAMGRHDGPADGCLLGAIVV